MKLSCEIALDYSGNPKIKVTKDKPQVTLDICTQDINLLQSLVEQELFLITEER
jgi:hypothetical protein